MKWFLSFIIAVVAYLVLGLIAWNIVCSCIDVPSKTLIQLADYRIWTYSGFTSAILYIVPFVASGHDPLDDSGYLVFLIPLVINVIVALVVNHWEGVWPGVSLILSIVYNIINVGYITLMVRSLFD